MVVGRSDTRRALREFFEVDRHSIVVAALAALHAQGEVEAEALQRARSALMHRDAAASWSR